MYSQLLIFEFEEEKERQRWQCETSYLEFYQHDKVTAPLFQNLYTLLTRNLRAIPSGIVPWKFLHCEPVEWMRGMTFVKWEIEYLKEKWVKHKWLKPFGADHFIKFILRLIPLKSTLDKQAFVYLKEASNPLWRPDLQYAVLFRLYLLHFQVLHLENN